MNKHREIILEMKAMQQIFDWDLDSDPGNKHIVAHLHHLQKWIKELENCKTPICACCSDTGERKELVE